RRRPRYPRLSLAFFPGEATRVGEKSPAVAREDLPAGDARGLVARTVPGRTRYPCLRHAARPRPSAREAARLRAGRARSPQCARPPPSPAGGPPGRRRRHPASVPVADSLAATARSAGRHGAGGTPRAGILSPLRGSSDPPEKVRIAHITATYPPYRGGTGRVC